MISDLATFYSGLEALNVTEPLTFSFEDLIHNIMNCNEDFLVRLGLIRTGNEVVIYKALLRSS